MNWLEKIPNWIKIPLKILLPSLFIFSGFLLIASDSTLTKLFLKDFRDNNGFAFGLMFLISLSLIVVYIIFFAGKPVIQKIKSIWMKNRLTKKIFELKDPERMFVFGLYNHPLHAYLFPFNDPTVNMLRSKGYLFTAQQTIDVLTYGEFAITSSLQPIFIELIDKAFQKVDSKIQSMTKKLKKLKDEKKKKKLENEINTIEANLKGLRNINLDDYFNADEEKNDSNQLY